mgnify:CR=1 FL=1|jgi:hypothetical protein|tara:strand:+ start:1879 stop:2130 length:252 start_codon:yes stop_codon:yes gene_type:complete
MEYKDIPLGVLFTSDTLGMVIVRIAYQQWAIQIGGDNPGRMFWPNEIQDVQDWELVAAQREGGYAGAALVWRVSRNSTEEDGI